GEERKWAVALPQTSRRNLPTIRAVAAAANVGPVRCAPKHRGRGANAVPRVGWMPYGTYLSAAQRVRIRPSKESGKRARKKVLGSGKRLAGCGKSTRRPLGAQRSGLAALARPGGRQRREHLVQQGLRRIESKARLDAGPGGGRVAQIQGCRREQAVQREVARPAFRAERGQVPSFGQATLLQGESGSFEHQQVPVGPELNGLGVVRAGCLAVPCLAGGPTQYPVRAERIGTIPRQGCED